MLLQCCWDILRVIFHASRYGSASLIQSMRIVGKTKGMPKFCFWGLIKPAISEILKSSPRLLVDFKRMAYDFQQILQTGETCAQLHFIVELW